MTAGIQRAWVLVICILLVSCAAPPSPGLRAFGDQKHWLLLEDMTYKIGQTDEKIVVPKGFVTDLASIPQGLWLFGLTPQGQYGRAAIVHDYLYWSQGCRRDQADRLMVIAMKESGVGRFDEFAIYQGVNLGGRAAWEANAKELQSEFPRIVPDQYLRPEDSNVTWPEYRKMLIEKQIKDPLFEMSPTYCKLGDSMRVP